jgi:hypothetical protein
MYRPVRQQKHYLGLGKHHKAKAIRLRLPVCQSAFDGFVLCSKVKQIAFTHRKSK